MAFPQRDVLLETPQPLQVEMASVQERLKAASALDSNAAPLRASER